jgi:VanZ family protein
MMQSIADSGSSNALKVGQSPCGQREQHIFGLPASKESLKSMMRLASLILLMYWSAIFIGTHLPGQSVPKVSLNDKVLHFGAFLGLAFLLAWAIPTRKGRGIQHALVSFGIVALYAGLDELTQNFIPGRNCCGWDLLADLAGAATGIGLYWVARSALLSFEFGRRAIARLSP